MVGRIFIFILVLAVALALLLTTCHSPEPDAESTATYEPAPTPPEEPEPPEEPTPAPPEEPEPTPPEEPEPELPEEPEPEPPEEPEPEPPEEPEPEPPEEPEPEEPAPDPPEDPSGGDGSIAQLARELIGSPFLAGGSTPTEGFDNSGFIYYVLNSYGISCPRRTQEQTLIGPRVYYLADLLPGDLAFFGATPGDNVAVFGGIYVGEGNMVFVSGSASAVVESDITQAWFQNIFVSGARVEREQ